MYHLGKNYEDGLGFTKSKQQALKYYRKALENGYEVAKDELNRLY